MHPLFAQLLQRRATRHESIPGHVLRTSLGPSREMSIRRPGAANRPGSGMVLFMSQPPRPLQAPAVPAVAAAEAAPPAPTTRSAEPEGVHLRIDPQDHQRVRISGSMREVCAALDALIAVQ